MSDPVETVLSRLAAQFQAGPAVSASAGYSASSLRLAGVTLAMAAEEYGRAAERYAAENRALRALFARVAERGTAPGLAVALRAAAQSREADLRIATLREANARLKETLIQLHDAVQASAEPSTAALDREIWQLLARFAADEPSVQG